MIVDAYSLPDGETLETEVCIIGAGAAGITLAREFIDQPFRVSVLESGGFEIDQRTQSLYQGKNVGLPYFPLEVARLRYFGGTTNHWGGLCRPFDDFTFEERKWIPFSGWPIGKADLLPYYDRAATVCQLRVNKWDTNYWEEIDKSASLSLDQSQFITRVAQQVSRLSRSFGLNYRDEVIQAKNIITYLNANVLELESDETGRSVTRVRARTLSGNSFSVSAKIFVLATGGIENPRLLLLSNKRFPAGLGNHYDLVGRFFLEHPRFSAGVFQPATPQISVEFYKIHQVGTSSIKGYLSLPPERQQSEGLVDVQVRLSPVYQEFYKDILKSKGGRSLFYLLENLWTQTQTKDLGKHLSRVVFDIDSIPFYAYGKYYEDELPVERVELVVRIDAAPNPDSRVTLSAERDALGQNKVELDWRLSPIDKYSARRTLELLGMELGRAGLGRLQSQFDDDDTTWPSDLAGGFHHMGTTRMSDDPKQGVVDRHCQVHDISNLYIAGSSVFPTAGSGTPTMTIVALALRLADEIKARIIST